MKHRGFTLLELMIAIVFVMAFVSIISMGFAGMNGNSTVSVGYNGITESRCIEGYKFIVDQNGNTRQILDEFGKGARCENNVKSGGF